MAAGPRPGGGTRSGLTALAGSPRARPSGGLVGFVNVAWDGGDHAFLLDTKVAGEHQRQGIATALVGVAVRHAQAAGCEWLHVDFAESLAAFYLDACGFRSTPAGLIHLPTHSQDQEPAD